MTLSIALAQVNPTVGDIAGNVALVRRACDEAAAYPRILAAIGDSLGWDVGALWAPDDGTLRCVETWQVPAPFELISRRARLAPGEGLPGRVWESGEPAWIVDLSADEKCQQCGADDLQAHRGHSCDRPVVDVAEDQAHAEHHDPEGCESIAAARRQPQERGYGEKERMGIALADHERRRDR